MAHDPQTGEVLPDSLDVVAEKIEAAAETAAAKKPKRAKKVDAAPPGTKALDLASTGLQAFEMQKLHRSALKGAAYNPRILSDSAKRKLKTGLQRHGLVAPVTFNKRTGNIVGGHQRLSQLDALAGTANYELDVAVIDVDEGREKELNLLLNNTEAMGDFDMELLQDLLRTPELDLDGTGFDHADVFKLFGDSVLTERDDDGLEKFADKVRAMRDAYDGVSSGQGNRNSESFYLVVVFKDEAARDAFTDRFKLPNNRYQSGEQITELCAASENVVDAAKDVVVGVIDKGLLEVAAKD